jgi:hypothetical protein
MGLTAYYIIKNRIAVIFEEKIDGQDIGYGVPLTAELSKPLNATAIYTTNRDDDVLVRYVYKNGQELFFYNSKPGYFDGSDDPSSIENLDALLTEYKNLNKAEDIHRKIKEAESGPSKTAAK